MIGVFDKRWIVPMAEVLSSLGSEHVWVVHGSDGLDEITTTGPTYVAELVDGNVRTFEIDPADIGLKKAASEDLKGGDAETNAAAIRALLGGEHSPFRDIVIFNAAAALLVAGQASTLTEGAELAAKAIDSGDALGVLQTLIAVSNG
jgi:anthranilate phosphoribosyltransferase